MIGVRCTVTEHTSLTIMVEATELITLAYQEGADNKLDDKNWEEF